VKMIGVLDLAKGGVIEHLNHFKEFGVMAAR